MLKKGSTLNIEKSAKVYSYVRLFLIYDVALSPSNFPFSFSCVYIYTKPYMVLFLSPSRITLKFFFLLVATRFFYLPELSSLVPSSETLKSDNKKQTSYKIRK